MSTPLTQLAPFMQQAAQVLVNAVRAAGYPITVTSVLRTRATQERLYRDFILGRSKYPAAKPGTSPHERGLAFDVAAHPDVLREMGRIWESWGGTWGGRFKDPIHFEVRLK